MRVIPLDDPDDPRLTAYRLRADRSLRDHPDVDAPHGLFLAESRYVVERLLAAGASVRSVLLTERRVDRARRWLGDYPGPTYVVSDPVGEELVGFPVHRGVLAVVARPRPPLLAEVTSHARLVVYLDGLTDTENVGAVFRSAAALGADGVLVGPTTADPLYRRCVRVSMGASALVPWSRDSDGSALGRLAAWRRVALSPDGDTTLEQLASRPAAPTVLVVGTEGPGLGSTVRGLCDEVVRIPVREGSDSLNVATAAALALYRLAG